MGHAVLIVDDEETLARNIASFLALAGFETHLAASVAQALAAHEKFQPDVTLLDLRLPDGDGLDVLKAIRERVPDHPVIMMTAFGDVETAVEAMKAGAHDFLRKPLSLSEVQAQIKLTLDNERKQVAIRQLAGKQGHNGIDMIVGNSPPILALKDNIARLVAAEKSLRNEAAPPVLITGETGTGKELVARAIHLAGNRAEGPFIEINCASLPLELVESELFGHERGAFTDARERQIGLIEAADGGTLFLDEIGEMDLGTQAKILKVMEDRIVRRVGGTRGRAVDVRFLAATNRDPAAAVAAGVFREDLLYRLSVARFELPPLRTRGDDILLLANVFLEALARRYGQTLPRLSEAARRRLVDHSWPGNVRELKNTLERAMLFAGGPQIDIAALTIPDSVACPAAAAVPADRQPLPSTPASADALDLLEQKAVQDALTTAGWNVSKAARALKMSRDQVRYRIDKFDLRPHPEIERARTNDVM
jgi:DNA-binding NtrC family response regulator